ncbi:MAG: 1,4-dihydroxy-2-naphthoate polyprenyltransferase [Microscillaceae bacterium]
MATIQDWLAAARLRTLPLAMASIGMGSFLAAHESAFRGGVFALCILTTLFLQILSNFANDYGDSVSGVDGAQREGPSRLVQTGKISRSQMARALVLFSLLSLGAGLGLLWVALHSWTDFLFFLGLGLLAILAAITYTVGRKPYGYAGLGDAAVFVFFGLVAVGGSYYLHVGQFKPAILLPAAACGFLAVGVLNLNNIRDLHSDQQAGKKSVPVRLGRRNAVWYHWILLTLALLAALVYTVSQYRHPLQGIFLLVLPLLGQNAWAVKRHTQAVALDPYLRQLALTTLLFVLLFGLGNLWV